MNKNNSTLTINTTNNSADKSNKKTADNTANLLVDRYKTRPCKNYTAQGFCPYEERCMFAHGKDELRTREMNIADGLNTDEAIKFHQRELRYRRQVQERLAAVAQLHPATAVPLATRPQLPAPLLQPSLNNSKTTETVVSPSMKTTSRPGGHCPAATTTGVAALLFPPTPTTSSTSAVVTPLGATSYSTASAGLFDNKVGKKTTTPTAQHQDQQPIVKDEKKKKEMKEAVSSPPPSVANQEVEEEVSTPSFSYYAPLPFEGVDEMMSQNSPSSTSCTCDECWQQRKQQQQQQQQSSQEEEASLSVSGEEEEEEKQTAVPSYRYQHNPYVPYTCTTASALAAETPSQAVVVQPCGNCDACRNYEATLYQLQMRGRSGYISDICCRSPFHRQLKEEEETPLVRSAEAP